MMSMKRQALFDSQRVPQSGTNTFSTVAGSHEEMMMMDNAGNKGSIISAGNSLQSAVVSQMHVVQTQQTVNEEAKTDTNRGMHVLQRSLEKPLESKKFYSSVQSVRDRNIQVRSLKQYLRVNPLN